MLYGSVSLILFTNRLVCFLWVSVGFWDASKEGTVAVGKTGVSASIVTFLRSKWFLVAGASGRRPLPIIWYNSANTDPTSVFSITVIESFEPVPQIRIAAANVYHPSVIHQRNARPHGATDCFTWHGTVNTPQIKPFRMGFLPIICLARSSQLNPAHSCCLFTHIGRWLVWSSNQMVFKMELHCCRPANQLPCKVIVQHPYTTKTLLM